MKGSLVLNCVLDYRIKLYIDQLFFILYNQVKILVK